MTTELIAQAREIKGARVHELLSKRNVVGVGIGYKISHGVNTGELGLIVSVRRKVDPSSTASRSEYP